MQQATGHFDTPDEMYKYLVAVSREPDLAKIRAYCDGSVEHFNWLENLGFQFERTYYPGKGGRTAGYRGTVLHRHPRRSGRSASRPPAPRGHSVPVPGELGGAAMVIDLLLKRAGDLGVQFRYETAATNLVVKARPTRAGWSASHGSTSPKPVRVKANSVIIAAGGFAMNPDMVVSMHARARPGNERPSTTAWWRPTSWAT